MKNIPPLVRTIEYHGPLPCCRASKMCTHAPPPDAVLRIAVGANKPAAEVHATYPGGGGARSGCGLTHRFKSGLPPRCRDRGFSHLGLQTDIRHPDVSLQTEISIFKMAMSVPTNRR